MGYGLVIQKNRNELFENLAKKDQRVVVDTYPVKYMDLRPYLYSSTIYDFEVSHVDEMLKAICYNQLPPTIFLGASECNNEKIESLLDRGIPYEKLPIMIATSSSLVNSSASDHLFNTIQVKSDDALRKWCKVIAEGMFNNPEMDLSHMIQLFTHALEDSRYILALGYAGDIAVSAGIGYICQYDEQTTVGSLFMIATVDAYRGRGYGSKLTYALTKALLNQGATFSVLDASEMGASIYIQMGYEPVGYSYRFYPNHI
ncbi:GNAT family N-acetyltransferase [Fusibacter sp. 3D3]|uniref:GNAT family N-acetyltransferase n=1 Tax=Fusibacter sp. 3D3 TaxID=1048380 RepID=UPI000853E94B|nr:GNAT family N-acetyltransferase [Fusibacter sp. 3D3]GAU78980.1 hypothetical protein F3D3_3616 [Fusibacter sp. 3D3]